MASSLAHLCLHLFVILYATSSLLVRGEVGCPPAEDVEPCICSEDPLPRLVCRNIFNSYDLRNALVNSKRYTYQEMHLQSSAIRFLDSDVFEKVHVKELYIKDTTLLTLFTETPRSNSLYKLQLDNTRIGRFFENDAMRNYTSIKILVINGTRVPSISYRLTQNFPSNLRQITFNGTETKKIIPGAFAPFEQLDKLVVSHTEVSKLRSEMFNGSSSIRFLYLDNNNISSIPEDLLTNLPNLQFLTMRNNRLTEIPEAAFGDRGDTVPYMRFDGNPLKCNCLLVWLVKEKPEVIGGTCSAPSNLRGRHLQDLLPGDFNC